MLVGRDAEVAQIGALVRRGRLLTVTGAPGVGKSALVAEVVATLDPPLVVATVALGEVRDAAAVLTDVTAARGTATVVVLDDCDRVVAAAAHAARTLVAAGVAVFATCREPLCVEDEVVWRLAPLALPPAGAEALPDIFVDSDAVRLFCEGAAGARRGFVPTAEVAATLVRICRRLDGLPLAIQLASRWAHVLSVPDIEARLDDPLTFLVAPDARTPGRHASLGEAIAASYDRLPAGLQALWRRLSVFAGGFGLDGAEAVRGEDVRPDELLGAVAALVNRSLVEADTTVAPTVYRLLEPLRLFARARLEEVGEAPAAVAAHTRWCAELATAALDAGTVEGDARLGFYRLDIPAAARVAFEAKQEDDMLTLGLASVVLLRSAGDDGPASDLLERMLSATRDGPASARRAALLRIAGEMSAMTGDLARATALLADAATVAADAGDGVEDARSRTAFGVVSVLGGHTDVGLRALTRAVALARTGRDQACLARSLAASARAHLLVGNVMAAAVELAESRASSAGGEDGAPVDTMLDLGWAGIVRGEYDEAESNLLAALREATRRGDPNTQGLAHAWLGELTRLRGDEDRAEGHLRQCLAVIEGATRPYPEVLARLGLGRLAIGRGDHQEASEWFQTARAVAERHAFALVVAPCLHGLAAVARDSGDEDGAQLLLEAALASARRCEDKASEADGCHGLGAVVAMRRDDRRAVALYQQALAIRRSVGDPAAIADSVEALAGMATRVGDFPTAALLLGGADRIRTSYGCAASPALHRDRTATLVAARTALGEEQFTREWSRGSAMALDATVETAARHGPRERRPAEGLASLTPSEQRVAGMAARGMTNKAIARELAGSVRTVETHLQRIYRKLGIHSREQLDAHVLDTQ